MKVSGVPSRCAFAVNGQRHGCGLHWNMAVKKIPKHKGKFIGFFMSQTKHWCMCSACFDSVFGHVYGPLEPDYLPAGTESWYACVEKDPLFNENSGRWLKSAREDKFLATSTYKRPAAFQNLEAPKTQKRLDHHVLNDASSSRC